MENIDTNECFVFAWETFKKRPWFFVRITALVFAISIVTTILRAQLSNVGSGLIDGLGFFIAVGISVYVGFIQTKLYLKVHDSVSEASLSKELWSTKDFWKFALLYILLGIALVIGFVLLVIPGIILALVSIFSIYIYIDKGRSPMDSFMDSVALTRDHLWEVFIFMLELLCINILGAILLLVGLLISVPVSLLATVHLYRTLQQKGKSSERL
jgi:uncharacterized membrane protein